MVKRICGIVAIFLFTSMAWMILGTTVMVRTGKNDSAMRDEVGQLWGVPQRQKAPVVTYCDDGSDDPPGARVRATTPGVEQISTVDSASDPRLSTPTITAAPSQPAPRQHAPVQLVQHDVPLDASQIDVSLDLEHRMKGLLWYSTYRVGFAGDYKIANTTRKPHDYLVTFTLPAEGAVYDNFQFASGGTELENLEWQSSAVTGTLRIEPGQERVVHVAYGSQGLDSWGYDFGDHVNQIRNFSLRMHTNFSEINFPQNSISPTNKTANGGGWDLDWQYTNLLSGVQIGMAMPQLLNPGPWVSEISFFAPVSLFFFFFVLFIFSTMRGVSVHPFNYFFIGCGFFSFHLLLTYLADHVSIHVAFVIASVVSLFLVISYMRLVVGQRFAIVQVGISQFIYLVLFSYTFFFERYTGLAVTIMCILTLFVVMQMTGRIRWEGLSGAGPGGALPHDGPGRHPGTELRSKPASVTT